MKLKFFPFIVFLFVAISLTKPQQITFYEPYPQFQSIYGLIDDLYSSYYFFGYNYINNTSQRYICKATYYGTLEWMVDIGSDYQGYVYLSDNFTPMWATFSGGDISINEATPDGYLSTRKVYSSNNYLSNAQLIRFDDRNFAAIYLSQTGTTQYFYNAIIFDENFQFLKYINFNNGNNSNSGVLSSVIRFNNRYAFIGYREILIINDSNEKIAYLKFNDQITSIQKIDDNSFFVAFNNRICKYSKDGILINTTQIPFSTYSLIIQKHKNGNFVLLNHKITLVDSNGNILWSKNTGGFPGGILINTNDGGYLGGLSGLLKLDENFCASVFKDLSISSNLIIGTKAVITWIAVIENTGTLEYSKDGVTNWQKIAEVNLRDAYYEWNQPTEITQNAKVRLTINGTSRTIYSKAFNISYDTEIPEKFFVNRIKYYYKNDGSINSILGSPLYWYETTNPSEAFLYSEGLNWVGKVDGELKGGGVSHSSGLQPGNIISLNKAANPTDPKFKSWKYNSNWQSLIDTVQRYNYKNDLNNWPVDLDAPWIDLNRNGKYEPAIGDKPKTDADEIHWMVMNDLDTVKCKKFMGSNPIGLEVQLTFYGYKQKYPNVIFKDYILINKSGSKITDMYLSYFADDDLGVTSSNYIGCDSTLSLAYTYCANDRLDLVFGDKSPTIGHMILQGPIVQSIATNQALFKGRKIIGFKNLSATSITGNLKGISGYNFDPPSGSSNYQATIQYYNIMKGLHNNGSTIINPLTNKPAVFHFSGDPETGTGWLNNIGSTGPLKPGDRRYHINIGPFTMEPYDTQEVVIALLIAKGINNYNSVTELKKLSKKIRDDYFVNIVSTVDKNGEVPNSYELSQNFPNPFNPETKIRFQVPSASNIKLTVYDILGRKISDLVDEFMQTGMYEINFSSREKNLASGIYLYKLSADNFVKVRKMILLK